MDRHPSSLMQTVLILTMNRSNKANLNYWTQITPWQLRRSLTESYSTGRYTAYHCLLWITFIFADEEYTSDIMVWMCKCQQWHLYIYAVWALLQGCGWSSCRLEKCVKLVGDSVMQGTDESMFQDTHSVICCACSSVHCSHPGNFWNTSCNES